MEENTVQNPTNNIITEAEENSTFNLQSILAIFILNWQWFVLSVVICFAAGIVYIKYQAPIYQTNTKIFIQDNNSKSAGTLDVENLGLISNSSGLNNEMEILSSHSIALNAVKKLKLYTTYKIDGKFRDQLVYGSQPFIVDLDAASIDKLTSPISLEIKFKNGNYIITGQYTGKNQQGQVGPHSINTTINSIPAQIPTAAGTIRITKNPNSEWSWGSKSLHVTINSPKAVD